MHRETDPNFDEVFLTGATGFIGSHVLRVLLTAGYRVKALVRTGSSLPSSDGCLPVSGDVTRPGELARHMAGCRFLVHVAALYSFDSRDRKAMWDTNVRGTAGVLEAGRIAGIERAVVTSSSATVGPSANGLRTEDDWAEDGDHDFGYHHSKLAQERAALAAQLLPVLVLPTAPVGPGDWRPTPTGKMIVDFMRGKIFGSLPGGLNVVAVEDVARAHLLALQHGRDGERYLIGGENLTLVQLWQSLSEICGRPAPTREVPYPLAYAFGRLDEIRSRWRPDKTPLAPLEGVRMGRQTMHVSCEKAEKELGYRASPVKDALQRAVSWYRDNGYAT